MVGDRIQDEFDLFRHEIALHTNRTEQGVERYGKTRANFLDGYSRVVPVVLEGLRHIFRIGQATKFTCRVPG